MIISADGCVHTKSLPWCLMLCNAMDCSPPGSSVHGILQAKILEWVAMPSSRGSSQPNRRQEEKGTTEDEMVGWRHRLNGHEFEQAPGVGEGQGGLACCSPWDPRVTHDWVTELNFILKLAFWQHPSLPHAKYFDSRPGISLPLLLGRKAKRKHFRGKEET